MKKIFLILLSSLFIQNIAISATCYVPSNLNNEETGDNHYSRILGCDKYYIEKYWDEFNMMKHQWDDGFGYHNVCNNDLPLGRMMNAIHVLNITKNIKYKKSILNWAYDYAEGDILVLSVGCGDGSLNAQNILAKVTFYMDGLYDDKSVVRRAGILLHESRHTRRIHNGWGNCPSGASCDSSWGYGGSNQYHVLWLWWFGRYSKFTTKALKKDALRDARWRHDNRFNINPGKNI